MITKRLSIEVSKVSSLLTIRPGISLIFAVRRNIGKVPVSKHFLQSLSNGTLKYCSTSCSEEAPDLWKPAKPLITVPVVTWGKKLLVIA